jgi:hypothetical protein
LSFNFKVLLFFLDSCLCRNDGIFSSFCFFYNFRLGIKKALFG